MSHPVYTFSSNFRKAALVTMFEQMGSLLRESILLPCSILIIP